MKFGNVGGRTALITDEGYADVEQASGGLFPSDALGVLDRWEEFRDWAATATPFWASYQPEQLGSPVPLPRQVFALAANYRDHAAEAGLEVPENPYVFTKFPSCITGPRDDVLLSSNRCDWEVELVVIIGRRTDGITVDDAWSAVAGLAVGQDISDRRVQFRKPLPHLCLGKSFPTFGPVGPWLTTLDELPSLEALPVRCLIDEELMQDSSTDQMVFSVPELISSLSSMVTLLPGDFIFTGTPAGVGSTRDPRRYLEPGQVITSEIEGLGSLHNPCVQKD